MASRPRSARNRARRLFSQSRIALLQAASDAFDAREGPEAERNELRARSEALSEIMMHVAQLIDDDVAGLERQERFFLAAAEMARATKALFDIATFVERGARRRMTSPARVEGQAAARTRLNLLLPMIRRSLGRHGGWEPGTHARALLAEANRLLDRAGQRKISHWTLREYVLLAKIGGK
jgi:hypothetical protein